MRYSNTTTSKPYKQGDVLIKCQHDDTEEFRNVSKVEIIDYNERRGYAYPYAYRVKILESSDQKLINTLKGMICSIDNFKLISTDSYDIF